jgi:molybdopterin/thiamine biosynthesis adenylyltransferase
MSTPWTLVVPESLWAALDEHLFPGDGDEHGAVVAAGLVETSRGVRLLAREMFPAQDGVDFVTSTRAYRRLTPEFVNEKIRFCRDQRLVYLAVHNHGGKGSVAFSGDDMASHERGYPALLDIARGLPVGALVIAKGAVAGDIWTGDGARHTLAETVVVGRTTVRRLHTRPEVAPPARASIDDRQARIFGDAGQALLARLKVGVIGAGGVGLPIVAHLARLGVGRIVVVDPDRVEVSNLPRLPAATRWDAWLRVPKVRLARRVVRRARRGVHVTAVKADITAPGVASQVLDCDWLFLAADTHQARAVFNAIVHASLVPGTQIGSKVEVAGDTGTVESIFSVVRPVRPDIGCLLCNGLISPAKLTEEALAPDDRARQRYLPREDAPAPSVITLNALGVAQATNEFLLSITGLRQPSPTDGHYRRYETRTQKLTTERPRRDADCPDCGEATYSLRGRGDFARLPVRVDGSH